MREIVGRIIRLSMPTYDETSLFGLSLSYLLVLSFSKSFHFADWRLFETGAYAIYVLFFVGMATAILNALIPREKTTMERKIMLWFAALGNGMSAIWAGALTLDRGLTVWSVLPVLNVINGYILVVMPRAMGLDEEKVLNEDASARDILWVTFAVSAVYFVGENIIGNIWPYTLAMCVVYANNINRPFTTEFLKARSTAKAQEQRKWLNKAF